MVLYGVVVAGKMEEDNGSGDSQPSPPPVTTSELIKLYLVVRPLI